MTDLLKSQITEKLKTCNDDELLDLILKLLIFED